MTLYTEPRRTIDEVVQILERSLDLTVRAVYLARAANGDDHPITVRAIAERDNWTSMLDQARDIRNRRTAR